MSTPGPASHVHAYSPLMGSASSKPPSKTVSTSSRVRDGSVSIQAARASPGRPARASASISNERSQPAKGRLCDKASMSPAAVAGSVGGALRTVNNCPVHGGLEARALRRAPSTRGFSRSFASAPRSGSARSGATRRMASRCAPPSSTAPRRKASSISIACACQSRGSRRIATR
jgi:hypothetical protein